MQATSTSMIIPKIQDVRSVEFDLRLAAFPPLPNSGPQCKQPSGVTPKNSSPKPKIRKSLSVGNLRRISDISYSQLFKSQEQLYPMKNEAPQTSAKDFVDLSSAEIKALAQRKNEIKEGRIEVVIGGTRHPIHQPKKTRRCLRQTDAIEKNMLNPIESILMNYGYCEQAKALRTVGVGQYMHHNIWQSQLMCTWDIWRPEGMSPKDWGVCRW